MPEAVARRLKELGPDTGFDSIGDQPQIDALVAANKETLQPSAPVSHSPQRHAQHPLVDVLPVPEPVVVLAERLVDPALSRIGAGEVGQRRQIDGIALEHVAEHQQA